MMFDDLTINKIQQDQKDETRRLVRNNRRPAVPGSIHKLKKDRTNKVYGWIKILDCHQEKLGDLTEEGAKAEGFNSIDEYLDYFEKVNGTKDPDTMVWVVKFELIFNPLNLINLGTVDTSDPKYGVYCIVNAKYAEKNEIAYITKDIETTLENKVEDIIWDLSKYKYRYLVTDHNWDMEKQEFYVTIEEGTEWRDDKFDKIMDDLNKEDFWYYFVDRYEKSELMNGTPIIDLYFKF